MCCLQALYLAGTLVQCIFSIIYMKINFGYTTFRLLTLQTNEVHLCSNSPVNTTTEGGEDIVGRLASLLFITL